MNKEIIAKLVSFGEADESIRAVILEGSQSIGKFIDDLSDYDVNIFTRDAEPYLKSACWLDQFGEVLVYQKEELVFYGQAFPSRLVVFKNGERIDFSFWPVAALVEIADGSKAYESYRNGYRVLVDKDGLAARLPKPDGLGFLVLLPDRDLFLQTVYNFLFEAYCVARSLTRGDLWYAKRIEASYIKDHLYQMVLWERQRRQSWSHDPVLHLGGKRFEKWVSLDLVKAISACFSPYDKEETWKSLLAMLDLFNALARNLSKEMGFDYPEQVSHDVLGYLETLKSRKERLDH
ncbi:MAG: aminoglycoside 6-adenylyltransferase [Pelolinea sp.]|nr:aminoglycoside 6-adenylyltransferase [Pelolinea sp.]